MKRIAQFALLALLIASRPAPAVSVTVFDSIVDLATNVTKNYTFTDPTNGLEVVVSVTMTPHSGVTNSPTFSQLDFSDGIPTHLGVESDTGGGDGNWVDGARGEGVDFAATLISASVGIVTSSIRFAITDIGIRNEGGPLTWTSSARTNSFS